MTLLSHEQAVNAMMWTWIADAFSRLAVSLGKAAVVAYVLEILKKSHARWQRWFLIFIAASNVCHLDPYTVELQITESARLSFASLTSSASSFNVNHPLTSGQKGWQRAIAPGRRPI